MRYSNVFYVRIPWHKMMPTKAVLTWIRAGMTD